MIVGIPKELKEAEARVGITPESVKTVIKLGHQVIIQDDAGLLSGFTNDEYREAGAKIVETVEKVWSGCDLLLKVKEPAQEERKYFRDNLTVFSFLHPASDRDLVLKLLDAGTTGISFDMVIDQNGQFPILTPMSLIAGQLSIYSGSYALQPVNGGRGVLLGGDGFPSANILILGAGAAGTAAAKTAIGVGANVCVLDINPKKLEYYNSMRTNNNQTVRGLISSRENLEKELPQADILIGAVYVAADLAPKLIKKNDLKVMRKGAALVDICIDQGGFSETSKATSILKPTYIEDSIVHYCVPNMPALVPRSSTIALNNAVMPWLTALLQVSGQTSKINSGIRSGLLCSSGKLVNKVVAKALNLTFTEY